MVKVNDNNLAHCRCPQCPVQAKSNCAKELFSKTDISPDQKNIGKLYCAKGKSDCDDLDDKQSCICPSCLVWNDNNLRSTYYCLRGSADDIG